ncbi:MAG: SPOR domain-containing protein [Ignavibacteriales bacterium]|nr:SPOR domain-containing protein [Ignavibacteriales bacterium]
MKQFLLLLIAIPFILILTLSGCSSSSETEKDEMPPPPPAVENKIKTPPEDIKKQSEAVNKEVNETEKPKYEPPPKPVQNNSDKNIIKGNFAVQIGAYKMSDNADRIASTAKERFNMNVITSFDDAENIYKVFLGDFETKDAARTFRDLMASKYPEDYKDAWVSEKPKK